MGEARHFQFGVLIDMRSISSRDPAVGVPAFTVRLFVTPTRVLPTPAEELDELGRLSQA